jgi:hypothetical protein
LCHNRIGSMIGSTDTAHTLCIILLVMQELRHSHGTLPAAACITKIITTLPASALPQAAVEESLSKP